MDETVMAIVTFAPAVRKGAHVIITIYGEGGCGKTMSAIKLGRGLVGPKGKVALLDTERGRGMIYAKLGYDYAELTPPFTPERYIEAIDAAEEAGVDALIIDSGSHEWEGLGGVLEIADSQGLQGLLKWAKPKARHKQYVRRLLNSRMHLLISLRAKEKLIQVGGNVPVPPGMRSGDVYSAGYVPIQDKRFIYETTVQLFLPTGGKRGVPSLEKCPEDLLGAFPDGETIEEETGRQIAVWIEGGEPVDQAMEGLKRSAEEAAGDGTEALRIFWRTLDKARRDRLRPHVDNLGSIASSADREEEDRRREQQNSHQSFRSIGGTEARRADDDRVGAPDERDQPEHPGEGLSPTPAERKITPDVPPEAAPRDAGKIAHGAHTERTRSSYGLAGHQR